MEQQQMASSSQILNIIAPLETSGYEVDIFASYYSEKDHPQWAEQVMSWYDVGKKRVVQ